MKCRPGIVVSGTRQAQKLSPGRARKKKPGDRSPAWGRVVRREILHRAWGKRHSNGGKRQALGATAGDSRAFSSAKVTAGTRIR